LNLILLHDDDFAAEGRVRLRGRRHLHVRRVLRADVGDRLVVGLEGRWIGSGEVTALSDGELELAVRAEREPPPRLPVVLALALPRPPMLRRVLQTVASMGLERLVLFHSRRVEKTFWDAKAVQAERLREQLLRGCEQGVDPRLPELDLCPRFRPFVEDALPEWAAGRRLLLPDPGARAACPRAATGPVCVVMGPEGGLVPYEVDRLVEAGFERVHLGPRILRVEAAVPALLARLA